MTEKFYLPWENTIDDSFKQYAACLGMDPEFFMPSVGTSGKEAREICNGRKPTRDKHGTDPCPVRQECLEYALQIPGPVFGIWGGKTERERRNIKREQILNTGTTIRVNVKRPVVHGTDAGYNHHRRKGQTPCRACKEAHSKANQVWRDRSNDHTTLPALSALIELVHAENARASRTPTRS